MKIDYKKLEKKFWFEDENGNEVERMIRMPVFIDIVSLWNYTIKLMSIVIILKILLLSFCAGKVGSFTDGFQKEKKRHSELYLMEQLHMVVVRIVLLQW